MAYLALACLLRRRLETHGVATLHVHFGLTSAVVGVLIRELGGPPWCVTIHGPEEFAPDNRRRLAQSGAVRESNDRNQRVGSRRNAAWRRRPSRSSRRVIGNGRWKHFPFTTATDRSPSAPIVCIARLDARKGHAVLLDALEQLADAHRKVRVELIGDGPLRAQIESQISRRGLSKSVVVRGWLSEVGGQRST